MLLITGINGLLGSALVDVLSAHDTAFVGIDRDAQAQRGFAFDRVDLTDRDAVHACTKKHDPDTIVHGAAMTAVDRCETERTEAWRANVDATATLAALCHAQDRRLIHVSTDYVFDGREGPYTEESPLSPLGVYAKTKAAAELAVRALCPSALIVRTAVPYGPYAHVKKDFVRWLREELTAKRPVRIVTDQISNPTYAPDLARMIVRVAGDRSRKGTLHLCGRTSLSRHAFALLVAEVFGLDTTLIAPVTSAAFEQASPRPMNAAMSVAKAVALGLEPLDAREGLLALRAHRS